MPPEGRKLLVLGTTSQGALMQEMELASAFNVVLHVPMLEEAQIAAVMSSLTAFAPQDVRNSAPLSPLSAPFATHTTQSLRIARADARGLWAPRGGLQQGRLPGNGGLGSRTAQLQCGSERFSRAFACRLALENPPPAQPPLGRCLKGLHIC